VSTPDQEPASDEILLDAALKISDGTPIDWETTIPRDSEQSRTFEKLRSIEALARQHQFPAGTDARATAAEAPPAEPPLFTWGHLLVRSKLGEGGFGEVFRAWDPALEREVALKLRRTDAGGRGTMRWLDEARRLARVRHPHVVMVHGADVHDGRAGIWTDLIRGRTLSNWLDEF
jgi:hypothetical protein